MGMAIQEDSHELDICWAALAVSILTRTDPDKALERLYRLPTNPGIAEKMCWLHDLGYTFGEIGDLFGTTKAAAFKRILRHKKDIQAGGLE